MLGGETSLTFSLAILCWFDSLLANKSIGVVKGRLGQETAWLRDS